MAAALLSAAVATSAAASPIPIGVLGDSDSQSYQDTVSFPPDRFGAYRTLTLQWTEVLARLRPQAVDFGPWGRRGSGHVQALLMDWIGRGGRVPPKEDYLHNLAYSGASCRNLLGLRGRQAQRLGTEIGRDPARWRTGIVVISIGVNDFGHREALDRLAVDPADAQVQGEIGRCLEQIKGSIAVIRARQPAVRFVLVGAVDNVDDPENQQRWQTARAIANIRAGLRRFDDALRALATADSGIAYADAAAWLDRHWGGRDAQGRPAYKTVVLDRGFEVTMSAGDDPSHALTQDVHAGLAWNTLWAAELVDVANARFAAGIAPITAQEIDGFLHPAFEVARAARR